MSAVATRSLPVVQPNIEGKYVFDSASRPGVVHTVEHVETATGWALACSCEGYAYKGTCWHLKTSQASERARQEAARPRPSREEVNAKMARFARN